MLEGHPAVSQFLLFDAYWKKLPFFKKLWHELKMWKTVRKRGYDLVINLTSGDRGALVAMVSGASIRIGLESFGGMMGKDKIFTHLILETKKPRHIVERYLDVVRSMGIVPQKEEKTLVFVIPKEVEKKVFKQLPYDAFILIHPASRCAYKHWPEQKFVQVISDLRKLGQRIILSGGKEEQALVETIYRPFKQDRFVHCLSGKTSLKELGALILHAKLLITVDSVPLHIASALKKPVVALFGPSDDIKWGPWQNPFAKVVRLDLPCKRCDQQGCGGTWISDCLVHLPKEAVLQEVLGMLQGKIVP